MAAMLAGGRGRMMSPSRVLVLTLVAGLVVGISVVGQPQPWLVWNLSASAPIGLYRLTSGEPGAGDFALIRPTGSLEALLVSRGYLPAGVPLIKRVAAVAGDNVCAFNHAIIVNGDVRAVQLQSDRAGRSLPRWSGCGVLVGGEYFLLGENAALSFDSRYFGPVTGSDVIGRLVPLWVWRDSTDRAQAGSRIVVGDAGRDLRSRVVDGWLSRMASLAAFAAPAEAASFDGLRDHVKEAAQRFGLPESWITAVIAAESNGDPAAVSPKGAMGLMQLMPGTWRELRDRHALLDDPFDPRANILAGTAYLAMMHDRFGYPALFAAYNAGPGRYAAHLRTGKPLPAETRAYVKRIEQMLEPGRGSGLARPKRPVLPGQSSKLPSRWRDLFFPVQ
ncbi:putative murein lytic transglycosylase YjbJ [Symbiodinium microadriaticum]|uniref:Putative murein lytic transglycosylase YjbJ n=1 Tax=Symbiodinium microadriaticum TaxID=2951 RepID=A0A1Q9BVY8_SYMMI|nr:putative murein lytic transglycosylase YjbJ [Symbiodinium microadriaticum]